MPEAAQSSQLGAVDFPVRGNIFAQPAGSQCGSAITKLTHEQQEKICADEPAVFSAEPDPWGRLGWTRMAVGVADEVTARARFGQLGAMSPLERSSALTPRSPRRPKLR